MSDELLRLTGAQAADEVRAGELDAGRAVRLLPGAGRGRGPERVPLGRGRGAGRSDGHAPGGRAAGGEGPVLHRGRPERRRIAHPRGLPAALHRHRRPQAPGGRRRGARQDQPGRVRHGLIERELGLRAGEEPLGPRPRARRFERRQRGGRGGRACARGRSAPTPAARSASRPRSRDRRPQAHLRRRLALRDDRLRLVARPVRPADPRRDRRRAAVPPHGRPRPLRLHLARVPRGGGSCRAPSASTAWFSVFRRS